ncbi:alpha-L-fucosidase [Streptomyces sp. NBC_01808]|uniref:alpha-L-fucosidase n=1 Tax=Streptomyces sp. NBC_01808 TaxID=2975947 RepID=UPI002DD937E0|nr:alpha-L-fucosidase [Streptomyces sp. NBC_01808]WSA41144.1 alpha-L-fucosidase [Streptomyces sp. NBC_01808]
MSATFGRRGVLATALGVPLVVTAGSAAGAAGGGPRAAHGSVTGPDPRQAGDKLASLWFGMFVTRELQPGLLVNDRGYATMGFEPKPATLAGDYSTPEHRVGAFDPIRPWESCLTITPPHWSWQPGRPHSDFTTVVKTLVAAAVGDGNLLLNVPPTKTGYLEDGVTATLREVGQWMAEYGREAIVGTHGGPYRASGIGGSTYRGSTVYVHLTDDLRPARLRLPRLNARVRSVRTFDGRAVPYTEDEKGDLLLDLRTFTKSTPDMILKLAVDRPLTVEFVTRTAIAWDS